MTSSRILAVAVIASVAAGTIFVDVPRAEDKAVPGAGVKWEYKVLPRDAVIKLGAPDGAENVDLETWEVEERGLNKLGALKWELVLVGGHVPNAWYYLKRPRAGQ